MVDGNRVVARSKRVLHMRAKIVWARHRVRTKLLVVAVVCSNKLEIQFGLLLVAGVAGRDAAKHSPPRRSQSGCGAGPGSQWVECNAAVIRKHLIFSHTTISHAYYHIPLLLPRIPIPHRSRLHKMRYFSQQFTYEYVAHPRFPFLESSNRHLQPFMGTCHHRDVA